MLAFHSFLYKDLPGGSNADAFCKAPCSLLELASLPVVAAQGGNQIPTGRTVLEPIFQTASEFSETSIVFKGETKYHPVVGGVKVSIILAKFFFWVFEVV